MVEKPLYLVGSKYVILPRSGPAVNADRTLRQVGDLWRIAYGYNLLGYLSVLPPRAFLKT